MAILVNQNTRVICQGFAGSDGTFPFEQAIASGLTITTAGRQSKVTPQ